jgi:hypothetical protein
MGTELFSCWRPEVNRSEPRPDLLESGARLGRKRSVGRGDRGIDPRPALRAQSGTWGEVGLRSSSLREGYERCKKWYPSPRDSALGSLMVEVSSHHDGRTGDR